MGSVASTVNAKIVINCIILKQVIDFVPRLDHYGRHGIIHTLVKHAVAALNKKLLNNGFRKPGFDEVEGEVFVGHGVRFC